MKRSTSRGTAAGTVRRLPATLVLPVLVLLLLLAVVVATAFGSTQVRPWDTARMLINGVGLWRFPITWPMEHETIILTLRWPRVLGAILVGAALSMSGALLQGLLRNPLADPYVVGTSGGASLGAVLGLLLAGSASFGPALTAWVVPVSAFLGGALAMLVVIQLSTVGGRLPVVSVLLSGFAVSTLFGYSVSLLLFLSQQLQFQLPQIYDWLMGRLPEGELALLGPPAVIVGLGLAAGLLLAPSLDAFSLGEEGASRLGISVERDKLLILMLSALLTAAAVSISGLVGFVGLVVPHSFRLICGPRHRLLLPASALGGGLFLVLADLAGRLISAAIPGQTSGELPVGIVTAFVGGPFFLWLLRRTRKEYRW